MVVAWSSSLVRRLGLMEQSGLVELSQTVRHTKYSHFNRDRILPKPCMLDFDHVWGRGKGPVLKSLTLRPIIDQSFGTTNPKHGQKAKNSTAHIKASCRSPCLSSIIIARKYPLQESSH